jgi:hypothetical protein
MWKKTEKAVKNPFGNIIIGTGDNPASDGREHNIIVYRRRSLCHSVRKLCYTYVHVMMMVGIPFVAPKERRSRLPDGLCRSPPPTTTPHVCVFSSLLTVAG